jgi:gliding motility-associated-like protein
MDENPVSINIEPVPTLCDDTNWQLSAWPTTGIWSGPFISAEGTISTANLQDGNYKALYKLITPIGCLWKDSVVVSIDKLTQPDIQYNGDLICGDNPVELTMINVDDRSSVAWYGPAGNKIIGESELMLTIDKPGIYWAEVSKFACKLSTLSIPVDAVEDSLFIPNVFTPNSDNINDYFEVRSNGIDKFNLSVYNRYGKVLFETNNPSFQWSAENTSSGVYFWSILYTTCWNERKFIKGWVHIIR